MTAPTQIPTPAAPHISCSAGCGRSVLATEIESAGWDYLPIGARWRCADCTLALVAVRGVGS